MNFQFISEKNIRLFAVLSLQNEGFDTFEHYGVDKYLTSAGLVVTPKYRGRGIGEHFLKIRRAICKDFDLKLTSTAFTSDFSNRIADKVGFKRDYGMRYSTIVVITLMIHLFSL